MTKLDTTTRVLAIGSGSFLTSLVETLLESGLSQFHVLQIDEGNGWQEVVQLFDVVMYVSAQFQIDELRIVHAFCRELRKVFIPALLIRGEGIAGKGMAGPLVYPDSQGCWETAWRRIHSSSLGLEGQQSLSHPHPHPSSSTAETLLANIIVFEWLRGNGQEREPERKPSFYLLDLETWEGDWHSFAPHPLVSGRATAQWVEDFAGRLGHAACKSECESQSQCECENRRESEGKNGDNAWFPYFEQLTSAVSGVFHSWEEGDLSQLPLSQCSVQPVDPQSQGLARLLPNIICCGFTHGEARREAGLMGIEAYVSRSVESLADLLPPMEDMKRMVIEAGEFIGVGAGESFAEGISRGLLRCLNEALCKQLEQKPLRSHPPLPPLPPLVVQVQLGAVEDVHCQFYLQALTTLQGPLEIALGGEVFGFPVVWVRASDRWHGCVGLNTTMALRRALQQALQQIQNRTASILNPDLCVPTVTLADQKPLSLAIPLCEEVLASEGILRCALQVLSANHKRLGVFDLELEPFVKGEPVSVVGVMLQKGVAPCP